VRVRVSRVGGRGRSDEARVAGVFLGPSR
jgi:hypothetical protein